MKMQIIQEISRGVSRKSLKFFKEHFDSLREVRYIVLYYAESDWIMDRDLFINYAIIFGEDVQLWLSGLTWGYIGEGPHTLYKVMKSIDPDFREEQILSLEWQAKYPIVFKRVKGKFVLDNFTEEVRTLIRNEDVKLPWSLEHYTPDMWIDGQY